MEDNEGNLLVVIFFAILVSLGTYYGCYRLGRTLERRALTNALADKIEDIYIEGRADGERACNHDI